MLEASDDTIRIRTVPDYTMEHIEDPIRVTAVLAMVDMEPDTTPGIFGSVPLAGWTVHDDTDLKEVRQRLQTAGHGYIINERQNWVNIGVAGYTAAKLQGYKTTSQCDDQGLFDADCQCTVHLPAIFNSTSDSKLFSTKSIPTLTFNVLLRPCTPLQVVQAVTKAIEAPVRTTREACAHLIDTYVSGDPSSCEGNSAKELSDATSTGATTNVDDSDTGMLSLPVAALHTYLKCSVRWLDEAMRTCVLLVQGIQSLHR